MASFRAIGSFEVIMYFGSRVDYHARAAPSGAEFATMSVVSFGRRVVLDHVIVIKLFF